jgi:hypothetical protein
LQQGYKKVSTQCGTLTPKAQEFSAQNHAEKAKNSPKFPAFSSCLNVLFLDVWAKLLMLKKLHEYTHQDITLLLKRVAH